MKAPEPKSKTSPTATSSATTAVLGSAPADPARARHIDPQWAGHYRALVTLRQRLSEDRAEELAAVAMPLESHSLSQADSASDEFDHDMLLAELSAVQDRLFEIDEALRRIENHTYGVCELTGKPIPRERLRAIPWTRFTKDVEARLERERAVGKPHFGELHSLRAPGLTTPAPAGESVFDQPEPSVDRRPPLDRESESQPEADEEREAPEPRGQP
jgi:RNA polymerase-binding transcription factor DksA